MSTVAMFTLTYDQLENDCKIAMDATLEALVVEKILDEKVATNWMKEHSIIIRKRSFFDRLFKPEKGKKEDRHFTIVKKVVPEEY
jgi:hypothetical protein